MVLRPSLAKTIPNTFLRKKRRSPPSPFKTQWHYAFDQQQALQDLKQLAPHSPPNSIHQGSEDSQNPRKTLPFMLNCLIDSFAAYNCEPTPNAYQFVIKTLIRNSQFDELTHVLSHLQNVEKFQTPERVFVDLIGAYGQYGMVFEAIDLFFRIPSYRCVPTANSLNALLLILCRNRKCLRFVPQLLLKSRDMNIRIEPSSFSILIRALCRIGRADYAVKLLNYMIDDGFDLVDEVCSMILSSLCQQKGINSLEVMVILEEMRKIGFCLGRVDFRNLISFLVRQGNRRDAFDVLVDMKQAGIKPDISCYTMVLHSLVEKGEFERAEDLFNEVLVFGLVPNLRTYNAYISGLCKQEKVDSAYMMINCMEQLDCQPDIVTYRMVLEGFCKVGELQKAREVWSEMKRKVVELDAQTYRIMIQAYLSEGVVAEACSLLEKMLSNNITPMLSTFDDIISTLCHGGLISEALQFLEKVCSRAVVPGSIAWEALLLSLNHDVGDEMVLLDNLAEPAILHAWNMAIFLIPNEEISAADNEELELEQLICRVLYEEQLILLSLLSKEACLLHMKPCYILKFVRIN
ncbi:hypothetical protein Cgig2_016386 [Carnegiea gigantea]|uniref:Pentatricopeptide repeat-containing protein n=1 Tax=Carnegiea gigantea TaxID=171969 RepID=A0A9Q1K935_9CARY|nr:hypothetical protein Cgig2_016386 [Carnegiea gigantea]